MSDKKVILTKEDKVATVTLNRPESNNAIDLNLVKDLYDAFKDCHHDSSIRSVIFTGNGAMFSAGGDLSLFNKNADSYTLFIPFVYYCFWINTFFYFI